MISAVFSLQLADEEGVEQHLLIEVALALYPRTLAQTLLLQKLIASGVQSLCVIRSRLGSLCSELPLFPSSDSSPGCRSHPSVIFSFINLSPQ